MVGLNSTYLNYGLNSIRWAAMEGIG